jgi:hypothetical protein
MLNAAQSKEIFSAARQRQLEELRLEIPELPRRTLKCPNMPE